MWKEHGEKKGVREAGKGVGRGSRNGVWEGEGVGTGKERELEQRRSRGYER